MKQLPDYEPNQILLMPPSMKNWLPADHPVYLIGEVVDQFDLSAIYDDYSQRRGAPPYEPSMMVNLLVYGYSQGTRSSRKLERACYEDVGFRVLSANQQPDHWTISNFRSRHAEALGDLFVQTVQLASEAGLVKLRHVATNGTRIKANASRSKAMSYAYMKREEERLRQEASIQGYNAQATVDAETQIIVASELSNQSNDKPHARMMLDQVEENLARRPKESSMDAGYYSDANLELHQERGIEPFIPPDRITHNEWRKQKPPRGPIPKSATQMGSDAKKAAYQTRSRALQAKTDIS